MNLFAYAMKPGMFQATNLLKEWNLDSGQQKTIGQFFDVAAVKEFIEALKADAGITASNDYQVFTKDLTIKNTGIWN